MDIYSTFKSFVALLIPLVFLVSCGGGGESGILGLSAGQTATNSASVYVIHGTVPAGSCPNNGVTVDTGVDTNGNAVLDNFEITGSQYLCSWSTGNNGLNGIAAFTNEPSGANCNAGGNKTSFGLDANQNNLLDSTEVASFTYICNGANGVSGLNGTNGAAGATGTNGTNGATGAAGVNGTNGTAGLNGTNGQNGATGLAGSVWLNGTGVPLNTLGVDGDYYLDVSTSDVYLKALGSYSFITNIKGATGATGATGTAGTNGTNGTAGINGANGQNGATGVAGSVWYNGTGAPLNTLGVDGDYYLDVSTSDVYLKALGTYSFITNIKGITGAAGATGTAGATGANGTNGATGATGTAGANGTNGTAGINGANGQNGATGVAGSVWYNGTGAPLNTLGVDGDYYLDVSTSDVYLKALGTYSFITNIKGITGAAGATGAAGTNGTNGTNGATGATGGGLSEYAYIYNLTAQSVAVEATVIFDSNGVLTAGISHTSGTAEITLANQGIYEIGFSISGAEPNQFALFVNGVVVPGSIFGSGAGTQQTHGQVILALTANSVITLVNHSSAAAVTLASVIGGTAANVNASIILRKLN